MFAQLFPRAGPIVTRLTISKFDQSASAKVDLPTEIPWFKVLQHVCHCVMIQGFI